MEATRLVQRTLALAIGLALLLPPAAAPAEEVGTVAAVQGIAEIIDGANAVPAAVGMAVARGNILRTGRPGRMKVVFQDDTMLTVSHESEITIDEQVFAPQAGSVRSMIKLLRGKARAVVSDYYQRTGSVYEIQTVTAVSGVRGTEFTVSYDPQQAVTAVMGISGVVVVHSLADPEGPGVQITAAEITSVAPGELPEPPRKLDRRLFQQELDDFQLLGGSGAPAISSSHALVTGSGVPDPERAEVMAAGDGVGSESFGAGGGRRDLGGLLGQSPAGVRGPGGQIDIDVGNPR